MLVEYSIYNGEVKTTAFETLLREDAFCLKKASSVWKPVTSFMSSTESSPASHRLFLSHRSHFNFSAGSRAQHWDLLCRIH